MTSRGRSSFDVRRQQGCRPAASDPMGNGDGEFVSSPMAQPQISPPIGGDPAFLPSTRSTHTSKSSSSTVGRTVLGLDAHGLFITEEVQRQFEQRNIDLQQELSDMREQMRQMQEFFSRMSQGSQPPRDPPDSEDA